MVTSRVNPPPVMVSLPLYGATDGFELALTFMVTSPVPFEGDTENHHGYPEICHCKFEVILNVLVSPPCAKVSEAGDTSKYDKPGLGGMIKPDAWERFTSTGVAPGAVMVSLALRKSPAFASAFTVMVRLPVPEMEAGENVTQSGFPVIVHVAAVVMVNALSPPAASKVSEVVETLNGVERMFPAFCSMVTSRVSTPQVMVSLALRK